LRISSVDCSHGATGVHDMKHLASLLMGGEKKNEIGVVQTFCPEVADRSAGTGVVVREPLEVGSIIVGVGPIVATLTVDSLASETRDQMGAVADVSTTQESSSGGTCCRGAEANVQEKKKEKRVQLVSPNRESEKSKCWRSLKNRAKSLTS